MLTTKWKMPLSLEVVGSNVRDFCMLERNFLSHLKLVLLLILLSSSALLGIRLPGPSSSDEGTLGKACLPVAIIQLLAAFATIAAAIWEYQSGVKGLLGVRAFLAVTRVHFPLMVLVTVMIVAISVIYLVYSA